MTEDLSNKAHVAITEQDSSNAAEYWKKARIRSDHMCSVIHPKRTGSGIFQRRGWAAEGRGSFISWAERADVTF